jgi:hypothetical protein
MKKYHWSLATLLTSWLELASEVGFVWCLASYIEVLATHNPSNWNFFKIIFIGRG